ncbi:hypothetical protein C8J56DRAFT_413664 [Mycena floridula]|nr:hypothetical protein C8J56DRAFT_413664 [Mycena floridula]
MSSAFVLCSGEVAIELALCCIASPLLTLQCQISLVGPTGFQQLVAATVISFNPVSRDYTSHLAFIFSLFAHIAASFWYGSSFSPPNCLLIMVCRFLGLAGKHGKSFNAARFHVTRSAGYLTAASRLLVNTVAEPVFILYV